jgi:hypothetical protein
MTPHAGGGFTVPEDNLAQPCPAMICVNARAAACVGAEAAVARMLGRLQ